MFFKALRNLDNASDASGAVRQVRRNLFLLGAVALLGTLLAVTVGVVALTWTFRALEGADRAAAALQLHFNVDVLHDELRDDVLSAAAGLEHSQDDFERHVAELERDLQALPRMPLPQQVAEAMQRQAEPLRAYMEAGRRLMRQQGPITRPQLEEFSKQWRLLEPPLEAISDDLRATVAQATASGRRSYTKGLALLALSCVLLAVGVLHTARRISHAVLETNRHLAEATEAARKAGQSRADFLAAMSHEIRTPMTGVLGMVDLLAAEDMPHRQKAYVESLRASGRHLLNVINDILDFTRIESGKLELEEIDFSLPELLERLRSLVHPLAQERGLALDLRLAPHSPPVLRGDPTRIQQVLLNLVSNAIKFTESGSVALMVAPCGGDAAAPRYRFEVRDTGVGIPKDRQAELFSAFRQADESIARRYGGSGLGLAISKRLVEAMGGEIGVESAPGLGSLFHFELPLPEGDPGRLVARGGSQRVTTAPRRILVAEDVDVNRQILQATLQRAGHELVFARDGAEAVALAQREPFDLVLMDVQMPVMDGIEATRRIRTQDGPNRAIPILALTANVMAQERNRYLAAGMDECLSKPIDWDQLYDAIARHGGTGIRPVAAAPPPAATAAASLLDDAILGTLDRMAGREQVAQWVRMGLASYQGSFRAMADPGAIAAEAHKMRGSSGTLGLARVRELAERLETAALAGSVGPAQVEALRQAVDDSEGALRERGLL